MTFREDGSLHSEDAHCGLSEWVVAGELADFDLSHIEVKKTNSPHVMRKILQRVQQNMSPGEDESFGIFHRWPTWVHEQDTVNIGPDSHGQDCLVLCGEPDSDALEVIELDANSFHRIEIIAALSLDGTVYASAQQIDSKGVAVRIPWEREEISRFPEQCLPDVVRTLNTSVWANNGETVMMSFGAYVDKKFGRKQSIDYL